MVCCCKVHLYHLVPITGLYDKNKAKTAVSPVEAKLEVEIWQQPQKINILTLVSYSLLQTVFGRPYYRSCLWHDVSSVICLSVRNVLYCGKMVCPSEKVSEGVNRKPGSKS